LKLDGARGWVPVCVLARALGQLALARALAPSAPADGLAVVAVLGLAALLDQGAGRRRQGEQPALGALRGILRGLGQAPARALGADAVPAPRACHHDGKQTRAHAGCVALIHYNTIVRGAAGGAKLSEAQSLGSQESSSLP
jgi:hypothetical protein